MSSTEAEKAILDKLLELCVDIRAHAALDCEITLCGNGTNCSEASNVGRAIEEITGRVPTKDEVKTEVKKLMDLYGYSEEDIVLDI